MGSRSLRPASLLSAVTALCLALPLYAAPLPIPSQEGWADARAVVRTANEMAIGYVELGEDPGTAAGPPVILLHGYTDSSRSWSLLAPVLQDALPGRRIIALELPGHGISDAPPCCYGADSLAFAILGAMDALGISQADLVGHSLGSITAAQLAATHPERVNRLVLLSSATAMPKDSTEWLWDNVPKLPEKIDPDSTFMMDWFANPNPVPEDFLARERAEAALVPHHVWMGVLQGLTILDWSKLAPQIKAPVMIVWGDQDSLFGQSTQDLLRAALPAARFHDMAGLGHNFFWEDPAGSGGIIASFL